MALQFWLAAAILTAQPLRLAEPAEVVGLTDEMKQFAEAHVYLTDPPLERAHQLVKAIFDKGALGFAYDRSRTKTAAETFEEASGNCLSFTLMFVALARHVGLDASFQEVDVPPRWDKHGSAIVSPRHVNAIVDIEGRHYEIDLAASMAQVRLGVKTVPDERGISNYFSNRGVDFYGRNDFATALRYFERALEIDPEAGFVWANLAAAHSAQGDFDRAESAYLRALKLEDQDRGRLSVMDNLVKLYRKMGRHREAERYREEVADYREKNPFYHFRLGWIAFEANDMEEAVRRFKKAIKRRPHDDAFHFALAKAYAALGDLKEAEKSLKRARKYALGAALQDRYDKKLAWLAQRRP